MAGREELASYAFRKLRTALLAESGTCHLCGHGGADTAEHLIPVSRGGAKLDPDNLAPIHGVAGCPTCGRKCNNEKSDTVGAGLGRVGADRVGGRGLELLPGGGGRLFAHRALLGQWSGRVSPRYRRHLVLRGSQEVRVPPAAGHLLGQLVFGLVRHPLPGPDRRAAGLPREVEEGGGRAVRPGRREHGDRA